MSRYPEKHRISSIKSHARPHLNHKIQGRQRPVRRTRVSSFGEAITVALRRGYRRACEKGCKGCPYSNRLLHGTPVSSCQSASSP